MIIMAVPVGLGGHGYNIAKIYITKRSKAVTICAELTAGLHNEDRKICCELCNNKWEKGAKCYEKKEQCGPL